MKTIRLMLILCMGWLCVLALPGFAQQCRQDFVLINGTGHTINSVKLAHVSWSIWSKDVLGREVLRPGDYTVIRFPVNLNGRYWDMEVKLRNGRTYDVRQVDLCESLGILLRYRSGRMYYTVVTMADWNRYKRSLEY
jgi:hypothetical protein